MKTEVLVNFASNAKKQYEAPKIEFILLQTENGIAAGSTKTFNSGGLKDEWETQEYQNDLSW
ncbi:hypothetical protein D3C87_400270 [compost metagenome]